MEREEFKQVLREVLQDVLGSLLTGEEIEEGEGNALARAVETAPVEEVSIAAITVGVRRRQQVGTLEELARSIEQVGLANPILIRTDGMLICGWRRLEACRLLGWTHIPARRVEGFSDEAIWAYELAENVHRRTVKPGAR